MGHYRSIPELLTKPPECITEKLDTHSFSGLSNYMKKYYIENHKKNVWLKIAIFAKAKNDLKLELTWQTEIFIDLSFITN